MSNGLVYGQMGNHAGYGFIVKETVNPDILHEVEALLKFSSNINGDERRIFKPLKNGSIFYGKIVYLAESGSKEMRGQIFAHGYLFDKTEAKKLMKDPSMLQYLRFYNNLQEVPEKVKCRKSFEELQNESLRNQMNPNIQRLESQYNELPKVYFDCVINNKNDYIDKQIFQLYDYLPKEDWWSVLISFLNSLPNDLRTTVSWSSNSAHICECNDYKINFVSEETYNRFEKNGFHGGIRTAKIVIRDFGAEEYELIDVSKNVLRGREHENRNDSVVDMEELEDYSEQYTTDLSPWESGNVKQTRKQKKARKKEESKRKKVSKKKEKSRKKELERRKTKSRWHECVLAIESALPLIKSIAYIVKIIIMVLGIVYLTNLVYVNPCIPENGIDIHVSNGGCVFLIQFVVAFLLVDVIRSFVKFWEGR